MIKKNCIFTNDVETQSIWFNTLRDETGIKVIKEGMPLLLDIYKDLDIKSTFFFVGDMVKKFPEAVKMILPYGHEVASHGWTHEVNQAFDILPYKTQVEHLINSKKLLEDVSGQEVISFRSPALRVNHDTPQALIEAGYKIDSSVPSQRFDFFLSFGSFKKFKWLTAPRLPYRTRFNNLAKKGDAPLIEIPLSAVFFPYVGTTMRIFPLLTKMQHNIISLESKLTGKPVVFDIHPNELIDESEEKRQIHRRSNNFFSYILADLIRGQLKIKNLGIPGANLYRKELLFYKQKGFQFQTLKDYALKMNLF